ncbi:class III lanthionine synthetase LanKC N-terminal domain-containing protein [Staphylococcus agnetis]|uniref:class III lanthionine synthetase LanKC N-terminal domain-containing protein n=1 Tax=Staphylococcus agnetis TaxID=985762 RepID=UPI000D022FEB|nr:lanthionine synthetase LanC family protein [Staphylococcus agnetis]
MKNIEENIRIHEPQKTHSVYYDDFYKYVNYTKGKLPRQGWKIHISFTLQNYREILDIVSNFCEEYNIDYKYIYRRENLVKFISSDGHPSNIGKFVTIYPTDKKHFIFIVETLYQLLKSFKGPYIYSDRRYKDSIIFYRYGVIDADSDYLLCPNKSKIIDNREYFELPYFESDPFESLYNMYDVNAKYISLSIKPYKILRSSSSGNVYLAEFKNKDYILKEGRPYILGSHGTAVEDIKNESKILTNLENLEGVPKVVKAFYEWENYYILQTYLRGKTFYELRSDIDFERNYDIETIVYNALKAVQKIHSRGIVVNDFNDTNLMVSDDSSFQVYICDFGSSYIKKSHLKNDEGCTKGYYDYRINELTPFQADYHKLGYTLMELIFPANKLTLFYQKPKRIFNIFKEYCIYNNISPNVVEIIKTMINNPATFEWNLNSKCSFSEISNSKYKFKSTTSIDILLNNDKCKRLLEKVDDFNAKSTTIFRDKITSKLFYYIFDSMGKSANIISILSTLGEIEESDINKFIKMSSKDFIVNDAGISVNKILSWIKETDDFSLNSGLAGLGLLIMGLKDTESQEAYFRCVNEIEGKISAYQLNYQEGQFLGLEQGCLGIALFYSRLYKITNKKTHLDKALKILKDVKRFFVDNRLSNEIVMPLKVGSKISTPYLNNGMAGFLYVAYTLIDNDDNSLNIKNEILNNYMLPYVQMIDHNCWTKNPGFSNGMIGIAYISVLIYKTTNDYYFLYKSTSILKNVLEFLVEKYEEYYLPDIENEELSLSFESGLAGFIFVINEIKNIRGNIYEINKNQ